MSLKTPDQFSSFREGLGTSQIVDGTLLVNIKCFQRFSGTNFNVSYLSFPVPHPALITSMYRKQQKGRWKPENKATMYEGKLAREPGSDPGSKAR